MNIYHALANMPAPKQNSAVALGFFDGLHVGHAAVISCAVQSAKKDGLAPAVFTFYIDTGPAGKTPGGMLQTEAEKLDMLGSLGVKTVLSPPFSEFRDMQPEAFVEEVLVKRLSAAVVCCGFDFRFGKQASAGVKELGELCAQSGISLHVMDPVSDAAGKISSTRIRKALAAGDVGAAAKMLGRLFGYCLPVVHGKQLGRSLGKPTINQPIPQNFAVLRHGVYASITTLDGVEYPSVTNIGSHPTVDCGSDVNSETYIHHYSGDLYGREIPVRLVEFLRDEKKFDTVEELRAQIEADADTALKIASKFLGQEKNERLF